MKTEQIKSITQDRPATWDEVRRAMSATPDRVVELCYTKGNYCEVDSDLGGIVRYPSDEFEFFAYLSEMKTRLAPTERGLDPIRIWHSRNAIISKMGRRSLPPKGPLIVVLRRQSPSKFQILAQLPSN